MSATILNEVDHTYLPLTQKTKKKEKKKNWGWEAPYHFLQQNGHAIDADCSPRFPARWFCFMTSFFVLTKFMKPTKMHAHNGFVHFVRSQTGIFPIRKMNKSLWSWLFVTNHHLQIAHQHAADYQGYCGGYFLFDETHHQNHWHQSFPLHHPQLLGSLNHDKLKSETLYHIRLGPDFKIFKTYVGLIKPCNEKERKNKGGETFMASIADVALRATLSAFTPFILIARLANREPTFIACIKWCPIVS